MNKTRLQELCHQRKWSLPKYSAVNVDGPPHNPSFKGSVFVNGLTFTSDAFHSSKEAHNQAALKALLNFSSPSSSSSIPTNEYGSEEKVEDAKPQKYPVPSEFPHIISDTDRLNKLLHQNYAQDNNLNSPVLTIEAKGPSHDVHYKTTVVIDAKSFGSPTFFNTKKDEEQEESRSSKSLLQELTQKKGFPKPTYKTTQIGSPHIATFFSTVEVEGVEFHGKASRSKKEAEHDAAKIAYKAIKDGRLHMYAAFSSSIKKNQAVHSTHESDILRSKQKLKLEGSSPTAEYGSKAKVEDIKPKESPVPAQSQVIITNTGHLSKNQLQNYARTNNLDPPVFTIKTEGKPHDIHYKATVVIDGKSFESPTFFNTIKEAEQAAAKIALRELPISVDLFQKDESCPSKSLLLELTQREGYSKPTYTTTESGSPQMPTFFSTVEVEGLKFHGKASTSKKQADIDAAKIAYIALKECGLDMYAAFSSSNKENQAVQSTLESDIVKYKWILNSEDKLLAPEILPTDDVKVNNESFPIPPNKKMKMSSMSSSSSPKSTPLSHTELPSPTISHSNMTMTSNTSSYLLCDRLKVYTSFPDIVFPDDITVLPIDNDKWVAACLEFPNDKDF